MLVHGTTYESSGGVNANLSFLWACGVRRIGKVSCPERVYKAKSANQSSSVVGVIIESGYPAYPGCLARKSGKPGVDHSLHAV